MALTYDLSKVKDRQQFFPDTESGDLNPVTTTIIFGTMITGIGELTEQNAPEFYARLHLAEQLRGPLAYNGHGEPITITPQYVKGHIGLKTNVFPKETRAAWLKRYVSPELTESVQKFHDA
jgi:hypothetical protein